MKLIHLNYENKTEYFVTRKSR